MPEPTTSGPSKLLLRTLAGETVACPPFWLLRQAGRYLPEYRKLRQEAGSFLEFCYTPRLAVAATLQPVERFGTDAAILFCDILVVPDGLGQAVAFTASEGPRLTPIRSLDAIARLSVDRLAGHLAPVYEAVREIADRLPPAVALIGFAGAPWTVAAYMVEGGGRRDFTAVRRWSFEEPETFGALMTLLVDATVRHLSAQIEAGAEVVQLFDSWAGALGESGFRRWVIGPTRAIVAALKNGHPAVPVIGYPRGAGVQYEEYVAETGVDAVGLDQSVPVAWAASRLQPRAVVQGNLDPMALVVGGELLRAETDRILEALGGGPFVFNLGHGILPATPPEHVTTLAELVRDRRASAA